MSADELAERLYRMFKGVPGFTLEEAHNLIEDSLRHHEYKTTDDVPSKDERRVLLYAQIQGAWQVAFSVAHYFRFTDGEESVDKSMVADNYRRLAKDLQDEYDKENGLQYGSNFRLAPRIDRPITQPITGKSARRSRVWRRY